MFRGGGAGLLDEPALVVIGTAFAGRAVEMRFADRLLNAEGAGRGTAGLAAGSNALLTEATGAGAGREAACSVAFCAAGAGLGAA